MPGSLEKGLSRIDGSPRVLWSGDPWDEQTDGLVSNELVDERIVLDQHVRGRFVEPAHQVTEV